jgi:16S rRNA (cytosine1407-C5)-methyltransferase
VASTPNFTAFDRFKDLTDLSALIECSKKPLRKSMRINTLKCSIDDFKAWATEKKWILEPVPWCKEAFFIDRVNREEALGKDLLHLLGRTYMQEAASMLPVELLQPEPGEAILDMSAAPGSKTTQTGAKMQGRGVIVANDVQEKRLWTLKASLHRCGVHNNIVTKKVGQWFSKQMTERFDRVLCDAPCSAMGTARKDSDALDYCSVENIEKMARLQTELLAAAIDATKVGGRIVYSTCTLTAEENEQMIIDALERYAGKLEIVDPRELNIAPEGYWEKAVGDSMIVQKTLGDHQFPMLRLWPQTYDTEGFFCAVLQKTASTRDAIPQEWVNFQEREMTRGQMREITKQIEDRYGSSFLRDGDRIYQRGDALNLANDAVSEFGLPVENYALGIPFGKMLKDGRVLIDHELVTLRGAEATKATIDLSDDQCKAILDAKDTECDPATRGHVILLYKGMPIGQGLAKDGKLKNNLPRWMVRFG